MTIYHVLRSKLRDDQGKVLRMQKMSMKDVHKLLGDGERILVHVDDLFQPIKAARVNKYCGAKLITELRIRNYQRNERKPDVDKYIPTLLQLKKKRKLTEDEFFDMAPQTKNETYVQDESKEFIFTIGITRLMDKARDLIAKKTIELGISEPVDDAAESEIHNAVWKSLWKKDLTREVK
ncbi:hypothetical protein Cgig2_006243 [Carnegiea gigantea]|uniref:Uncharacterized protein n=1 Tax=Carnegiea gigantea TaxID=171969 RepID=A0A9Q1GI52_9CARY|nr:hypothetical protein Cgig2_006243 [Carnegiea gigantea]